MKDGECFVRKNIMLMVALDTDNIFIPKTTWNFMNLHTIFFND